MNRFENPGESLLRCVALGLGIVSLAVGVRSGWNVDLSWSWDCVRDVLVVAVALGVGLVLCSFMEKRGAVSRRRVGRRRFKVDKALVRKVLVDVVAVVVGGTALVFMLVSAHRGLNVDLSVSVDCVRDVLVAAWPAMVAGLVCVVVNRSGLGHSRVRRV